MFRHRKQGGKYQGLTIKTIRPTSTPPAPAIFYDDPKEDGSNDNNIPNQLRWRDRGTSGSSNSDAIPAPSTDTNTTNASTTNITPAARSNNKSNNKNPFPRSTNLVQRILAQELDKYEILNDVEEVTGIDRLMFLSITVVGGALIWVLGITDSRSLTNLVGSVYPLFGSLYRLRQKEENDDLSHWLIYWVIFAFLQVVESACSDSFLLHVLPFYFAFKVGLLVWCHAPASRGAMLLYVHVLTPFLKSHSCQLTDS